MPNFTRWEDEELNKLVHMRGDDAWHSRFRAHAESNDSVWTHLTIAFNELQPTKRRNVSKVKAKYADLWCNFKIYNDRLRAATGSGASREEMEAIRKPACYEAFISSAVANPPQVQHCCHSCCFLDLL